MGNSMGNRASVRIVLDYDDCCTVQTEDKLSGKVEVIVRESNKVSSARLSIELAIRENACIARGVKGNSSDRIIQRETKVLQQEKKEEFLKPGVYYYPFKFILPGCLPPTIAIKSTNEAFAVTYTLSVRAGETYQTRELHVLCKPLTETDPSSSLAVAINGNRKADPAKALPQYLPVNQNRHNIGGVALGLVVVSGNKLGKGSVVFCRLSCRNFTDTDIVTVRVALIEQRYCTTDDKPPFPALEFLEEAIITAFDASDNMPGVKLKNKPEENENEDDQSDSPPDVILRRGVSSLLDERIRQKMMADLQNDENLFKLKVPVDSACDSYDGKLICVSHVIRLECALKNVDAANRPRVDVPVTVGETQDSLSCKLAEKRKSSLIETAEAAAALAIASSSGNTAPNNNAKPALNKLSSSAAVAVTARQDVPIPSL